MADAGVYGQTASQRAEGQTPAPRGGAGCCTAQLPAAAEVEPRVPRAAMLSGGTAGLGLRLGSSARGIRQEAETLIYLRFLKNRVSNEK